jgi:hypothetical protein
MGECNTCLFSRRYHDERTRRFFYSCQRHAPRPVVVTDSKIVEGIRWPLVDEYDWCGEFKTQYREEN